MRQQTFARAAAGPRPTASEVLRPFIPPRSPSGRRLARHPSSNDDGAATTRRSASEEPCLPRRPACLLVLQPPSLTSPCQHVTGGSPDVTKMSPKCHQNVTNCHKMSPRCHEMSRDVTRCHEVSRDVTEVSHCHQLSPTVTNCHQTVTKLSPKCHQNVTKCHQVSPSCHQLSPPVTTDHGASRALSV
jgi:hypothetical protein